MKIQEEINAPFKTITLSFQGNLDENSAASAERKILEAFGGEYDNIGLDLSSVGYISSIGIRVLIIAYKKSIKSGKKFAITKMSDRARDTLSMVGLLPVFEQVS